MILLSHPTGNRNVREALTALDDAALLAAFSTTINYRPGPLHGALPSSLRATLERRSYPPALAGRILSHPTREVMRLGLGPRLKGRATAHEVGILSVDAVLRDHDAWTAKRLARVRDLTAVYAYEDAARDTFQVARAQGLARIYEHPVGYWREVDRTFREEAELTPAYAGILSGLQDSQAKRDRKDAEIATADFLVLASSYSGRSLELYPGTLPPLAVIPYGAPSECVAAPGASASRLRVLFVGSLQQRKGVSYFVDAVESCGGLVETTIVGARVGDCEPLDQLLSEVRWTASMPHPQVLELMRKCDVLVLPSLSEGFGLVVLEAMSQGLTVIVSDNTGASDVVIDGENGFVVPIRSSQAIAERLEVLAHNPDRLFAMKEAALGTARAYTWEAYRSRLVATIRSVLES